MVMGGKIFWDGLRRAKIFIASKRGTRIFLQEGSGEFVSCRRRKDNIFSCALRGGGQKKLTTADDRQTAPLP